jgi:hypothetical protein
MRTARQLLALCALAAALSPDAGAAPGDVFVPAHRTRDGHYVPANVPPLSGGTHLARRPGRGTAAHRQVRAKRAVPLLADARPIRR